MYKIWILFCIMTFPGIADAQTDSTNPGAFKFFVDLYAKGDALKRSETGQISKHVEEVAKQMETEHPNVLFQKAGELVQESKWNDAAFIFYLGKLRLRYLESNRADYADSHKDMAFRAFMYHPGEPIRLYLQTNTGNYILILEKVLQHYRENDSSFNPRTNYSERYNEVADNFAEEIRMLRNNKKKYARQFAKERKEMEKLIRD
jgi:hypothetical protein